MISYKTLCALFGLINTSNGKFDPKAEFQLPPLGVNRNTVTVSGFSSGAYAAQQLHVIYSSSIKGAALMNGGSYGMGQFQTEFDELSEKINKATDDAKIIELKN